MKFPAFVTFRPTGRLMYIPDGQTFNASQHEYVRPVEESVAEVAPQEMALEEPVEAPEEPQALSPYEERFEQLKAERAWLVSKSPEVRQEYADLKAKLNK